MIQQFEALTQNEKELLYDAFPLITLLIAYADGEMDDEERSWAEKLTQIRGYSQHESVQEFYEEVHENFQEKLDKMLKTIPANNDERLEAISQKLSGLNEVLPKLDQVLAWRYYTGLLSFAEHVAKASGGFLGWHSISKEEKKMIKLEMINPIEIEEIPED